MLRVESLTELSSDSAPRQLVEGRASASIQSLTFSSQFESSSRHVDVHKSCLGSITNGSTSHVRDCSLWWMPGWHLASTLSTVGGVWCSPCQTVGIKAYILLFREYTRCTQELILDRKEDQLVARGSVSAQLNDKMTI